MFLTACLTIETDDVEALGAFYIETLGFKQRFRKGDWLELEVAGTRIALRERPLGRSSETTTTPQGGNGALLGLQSELPLSVLAKKLKERGLTLESCPHVDAEAGVELLFFQDPQGNRGYFWRLSDGIRDAS
ncbi:MAG: hypothetical protein V3W41_19045 [Planctomycetota bacterium]